MVSWQFLPVARSGREVLRGNGKLPTWDNMGEAFKDGIMIAAGLFMLLPAIVISIVVSLLMPAAWIQYAVTGDLFKALNPINALRLAAKNPLAYIGAVVATLIVQIVLAIPSVLVITVPWTSFAGYTSSAYIYAWFYKQTTTAAPVQKTNGPAPAAA